VDDNLRADFIEHPQDLVLIQNIQLHYIWRGDTTQPGAD
jgi:hypothetical protein